MNDHDAQVLHQKIKANCVPNDKGRSPPSCYRVTGLPKEHPDVWIKDPFNSIVLQASCCCCCCLPIATSGLSLNGSPVPPTTHAAAAVHACEELVHEGPALFHAACIRRTGA